MYYVFELQTNNGSGSAIPFSFSNINDARAKFHLLLSTAATSAVEKHGAMFVNEDGRNMEEPVMYSHPV